jgi:hypothetical protein
MVYFLKNNDKIKIGYTYDPKGRIAAIQTSNPDALKCLLLIDGLQEDEFRLHAMFSTERLRPNGEWFLLSEQILNFINKNIYRDRRYEYGLIDYEFSGYEQLRRLRKEHGLKLKELASMINRTAVSLGESEQREVDGTITIKTMKRIASCLGYKLEYRFIKNNNV